jgi:hypothetical protein
MRLLRFYFDIVIEVIRINFCGISSIIRGHPTKTIFVQERLQHRVGKSSRPSAHKSGWGRQASHIIAGKE